MAAKKTSKKPRSKKKPATHKRRTAVAATKAPARRKNAPAAKRGRGKTPAKDRSAQSATQEPKRTGALDAAAQVLRDAKNPMRSREIMEVVLKRGLWTTSGATPHATLSSAMQREIEKKGAGSRFKKAGPGLFALRT